MPLVDAGYFIPGTAFCYTAPEGTVAPAVGVLASPVAPWTLVGHLGLDDGTGMPSFSFEGGETTPKGSMSKKTIRTSVSKVVRSAEFSLSQFTRECLGLYQGGTGGAVTGYFDTMAADDGVPTRRALLFTFNDGGTWVGWWAGVTDILGADALDTSDIENAVLLPLKATVLDSATPLTVAKTRWIAPGLLALP